MESLTLGKGTFSAIPANVLESFIPGYSFISKFIYESFAIDIGHLVTAGVLIFLVSKFFDSVGERILISFWQFFTCSVSIDHNDNIYDELMNWFVAQRATKKARQIKIAKPRLSNRIFKAWMSTNVTSPYTSEDVDSTTLHDPNNEGAGQPIYYTTDFGSHYFWHQGRLFFLDRSQVEQKGVLKYHDDDPKERMILSCIGRSTKPIKDLLEYIRCQQHEEEESLTKIRRPEPADNALSPCPGYWRTVAVRPCRPLSTVTLDLEQKRKIVRDVNDYLSPAKARWYSARGIPYRRGYLFSGPPGTGKTSLSFALAGVFGLDLYVASLNDPSITDESLTSLFNDLPNWCIVLLEDIDSAGITRQNVSKQNDAKIKDGDDDKEASEMTLKDVAKAVKSLKDTPPPTNESPGAKRGISLSGLLNAIDGVATHEGHLLIMTTNNPENLDAALKRPGRVDLHVNFTNATKYQARDIFMRMYVDELPPSEDEHQAPTTKGKAVERSTVDEVCSPKTARDNLVCRFMPLDELEKLADTFTERVPELELSPAEIQGFLLVHKSAPREAVEQVAAWAKERLEAKGKRAGLDKSADKKEQVASSRSDSTYDSESSSE